MKGQAGAWPGQAGIWRPLLSCCCQIPGCSIPWINRTSPRGLFGRRIWGLWGAEGFGMDNGPALGPGASRATRQGGNGGLRGHGTADWFSQQWEQYSSPQEQPPRPRMVFWGHLLWLGLPSVTRPRVPVCVTISPTRGPLRGVSSPPSAFGEGNLLFPSLIPTSPHPVMLMEPKTSLLKTSSKPNPPTGSSKSEGNRTSFSC